MIYDAHELESGRSGQSWVASKMVFFIEAVSWRQVDGLISVSESILAWYKHNFGEKECQLIRNVPDHRADCRHDHVELRKLYSIPHDYLVSVYVGILEPNRGIRLLLKAFQDVQKAGGKHALIFMGEGSLDNEIIRAQTSASLVFHHGMLRPECIVPSMKSADVGLMLTSAERISEEYALPNKLFQYAEAGLHVVSTDLTEVRMAIGNRPGGSLIDYSSEALVQWLKSHPVMPATKKLNSAELGDWADEERQLLLFYSRLTKSARSGPERPNQKL